MRNKNIWELLCPKQKVKLIALILILMAGVWGWTTFAFLFPPMYQESQKVWSEHLERIEIKSGARGEEQTEPQAHATEEGTEGKELSSTLPSSEVIATTYNAEVGQTDSDPFTMASGKKVYEGAVASNCHELGTKLDIEGKMYTVEDRMNKRFTPLCGTENERVDIFKWNRADNFKRKLSYKIIN